MTTAAEAWTLTQTLREQGELEQAIKIAMKGLLLGGYHHYQLAVWASELAEGMARGWLNWAETGAITQ